MYRRLVILAGSLLLLPLVSAHAVLKIGIWPEEKDRTRYLIYEPMPMIVSIENVAAHERTLARKGRSFLDFLVTDAKGRPVTIENVLTENELFMPPGDVKNVKVDMTPLFSMRDPGRYKIQAVVHIDGEPQMISQPIWVYLDRGRLMWQEKRRVGNEVLQYVLLSFNPEPSKSRLYLRVENPDANRVYSTQNLGYLTQVISPKCFFDDEGILHVMHTVGRGSYGYTRASPRGNLLTRKIYDSNPNDPPRLRQHPDGSVLVYGGLQRGKDNRPTLGEVQDMGAGNAPTRNVSDLRSNRAGPAAAESLQEGQDFGGLEADPSIPSSSDSRKSNASRHNSKGR